MLRALGDPHKKIDIIHVTGTNGKGSVTAYISNILKASGKRVGRFNSPHLVTPRDAIRIDERIIDQEVYEATRKLVNHINTSMSIGATIFELTTATAFCIFADAQVEIGVIEVGMGGRLDATNVHPMPLVCCITNIGMDHMEFLGDSIKKIAFEKAGIFRPHARVVIGPQTHDDALMVLTAAAKDLECHITKAQSAQKAGQSNNAQQVAVVNFRGESVEVDLHLMGDFQLENVATAVAAVEQVPHVRKEHVIEGIRSTRWPGRLELVDIETSRGQKSILVDGAHNEAAVAPLRVAVDQIRSQPISLNHDGPSCKVGWIFAASKGKNIAGILRTLVHEDDVVCATEFGPVEDMPWIKCTPCSEIWDACAILGIKVDRLTAPGVKDAMEALVLHGNVDLIGL